MFLRTWLLTLSTGCVAVCDALSDVTGLGVSSSQSESPRSLRRTGLSLVSFWMAERNSFGFVPNCNQFHQHFTHVFLPIFWHQKISNLKHCFVIFWRTKVSWAAFFKSQSQNVTREKLLKALWYKKFARKMLMKFTLMVNFINVLHVNSSYESELSSFS